MKVTKGELVWFDIPVKSFAKSKIFYSKLLGWKFQPMGDEYLLIKAGKEMIGGLRFQEGKVVLCESPVMYFGVSKLSTSTALAKKLGAMLIGGRVDIPDGMGCFQLLRDQDKNLFGIWAQD